MKKHTVMPGAFMSLLSPGLNSEEHQMTGNYMWDTDSDKEFLIGLNQDSRLPLWWDGSEPLWVTMEKLKKRVYMYYWPGQCTEFCQ